MCLVPSPGIVTPFFTRNDAPASSLQEAKKRLFRLSSAVQTSLPLVRCDLPLILMTLSSFTDAKALQQIRMVPSRNTGDTRVPVIPVLDSNNILANLTSMARYQQRIVRQSHPAARQLAI